MKYFVDSDTSRSERLFEIYNRLLAAYGPQHWWPADSPFEVMIGAVLTQNTAWRNVEKAIAELKKVDLLDPEAILATDQTELAQIIRPSGYFNIKAERLRYLSRFVVDQPDVSNIGDSELRYMLLKVKGIGDETADDILLYAYERPVFVIDVYTRRLVERLGLMDGTAVYMELSLWFKNDLLNEKSANHRQEEQSRQQTASMFNEYHALIVRHAVRHCQKKPDCTGCCLCGMCHFNANGS